jgi:hypothetical protein
VPLQRLSSTLLPLHWSRAHRRQSAFAKLTDVQPPMPRSSISRDKLYLAGRDGEAFLRANLIRSVAGRCGTC